MTDEMKIAAIGECMIELSSRPDGGLALAYGGDTLNTAVYLARLCHDDAISVDYLTALGDDPYSDEMLAFWQREGIGTDKVVRLPGRLPGLYTIRTDQGGERSFHYWRSAAAACEMMAGENEKHLAEALCEYDLIYLSGITLSILNIADRAKLLGALDDAAAEGARIAFDCNYRPRGWPDERAARRAMDEMYRRSHVALPSLDDECALHGAMDLETAAQRIADLGVGEICLKDGGAGCLQRLRHQAHIIAAQKDIVPLDTTAAGDSFNAAYLYHRLRGDTADAAALAGHHLAAKVIQHPGAVIPLDAMGEET
ncbi:MAG: ketodeoxygluconokinase [Rhodospirillaceae bacterium]|jgi:2-dehydro-3-deoxygluconokinase|nr:ketodeoxygluconokinase [Rhodospirillaceae bacterium]MDP7052928.1 sugar kinase [Alphaproteobacteria bacterium]|tara:strand:- start:1473 stop:2408 length:936 start_codon:yes stop_codon:yes gene_type:complete